MHSERSSAQRFFNPQTKALFTVYTFLRASRAYSACRQLEGSAQRQEHGLLFQVHRNNGNKRADDDAAPMMMMNVRVKRDG